MGGPHPRVGGQEVMTSLARPAEGFGEHLSVGCCLSHFWERLDLCVPAPARPTRVTSGGPEFPAVTAGPAAHGCLRTSQWLHLGPRGPEGVPRPRGQALVYSEVSGVQKQADWGDQWGRGHV